MSKASLILWVIVWLGVIVALATIIYFMYVKPGVTYMLAPPDEKDLADFDRALQEREDR